jgi:hypothetical protein
MAGFGQWGGFPRFCILLTVIPESPRRGQNPAGPPFELLVTCYDARSLQCRAAPESSRRVPTSVTAVFHSDEREQSVQPLDNSS